MKNIKNMTCIVTDGDNEYTTYGYVINFSDKAVADIAKASKIGDIRNIRYIYAEISRFTSGSPEYIEMTVITDNDNIMIKNKDIPEYIRNDILISENAATNAPLIRECCAGDIMDSKTDKMSLTELIEANAA